MWVAAFDRALAVQPVEPFARDQYIRSAKDETLRRQRYAVWMLLDFALRERTGRGVEGWNFKCEQGKWSLDGQWHFSLSHSGNAVAVAVADLPVGVDIQDTAAFAHRDALARRVLSAREREQLAALPSDARPMRLAELWACKESVFKLMGSNVFVPSETDASLAHCCTERLDGNLFVVAVACQG